MLDQEACVEQAIDDLAHVFNGGFDFKDLRLVVLKAVQVAELLQDVAGEDKREFAAEFAAQLLEKHLDECPKQVAELIQAIDIPYLPEALERTLVDPVLERMAAQLVRELVLASLPGLCDLVVSMSKATEVLGDLDSRCAHPWRGDCEKSCTRESRLWCNALEVLGAGEGRRLPEASE